ncbi:hypothetical protein ACFY8W_27415 [Streptomyces sp. NPDC012637]|uniref:hypothetical protein n=1 Tax=Streptomyces sp. NPDC012637 TaxID=3364842 RepID=UPI0036EF7B99
MVSGEQVLRGVGGLLLEARARARDKVYAEGFDAAANICVSILSDAIDGLMAKAKSGDLSKQEQVVLSRLTELRAETEEVLRGFWEPEPTESSLS